MRRSPWPEIITPPRSSSRASGCDYTFLRDNFYIDFMADLVGDDGVIRGPAGEGRAAVVARADIARTAAAVLEDPQGHRNVTYQMTGPEALSMADVARIMTEVTGRPTSFHHESLAEAYASRRGYEVPSWQVDAWVSTYTAIAAGELEAVSSDIADITGTAAMTLAKFLRR